jgi:4-hydroxythreonine-4-phosphate dehydrogenase
MKTRRTIVITAGDPEGIGPEVIIKALSSKPIQHLMSNFNFLIVGPAETFDRTAKLLDGAGLSDDFNPALIKAPEIPPDTGRNIFLYEPAPAGQSRSGLEYILSGIEIMSAKCGKPEPAAALVTGPVSKESVNKTGFNFTGHTELLEKKNLCRKVTMMFSAPGLKVALATRHISYRKVLLYLTAERITSTIEQTADGLRKYFRIAQPRIAVCGLNPHAGEGRAFGNEESRIIEPAVKLARKRKINCAGPAPADSIFHRAVKGEFDAVVALYHDQGLIPIKTLAFSDTVQITLGLPFIRTSPAHGVAYDIAGKGIANPASMIEAIKLAASMGHQDESLFGNNQ